MTSHDRFLFARGAQIYFKNSDFSTLLNFSLVGRKSISKISRFFDFFEFLDRGAQIYDEKIPDFLTFLVQKLFFSAKFNFLIKNCDFE